MTAPATLSAVSAGNPAGFPRSARAGGWLVLAGFFCLGQLVARGAEEPVSKEYQLKAAYLYNFTKFVEWPAPRFADELSPLIIGVLGRNPFGDELDKIVRGRTVNGRAIRVLVITTTEEMRTAHVLFVPAGEETRPEFAAAVVQHLALLTAGESGAFTHGGGVITFTQADDKLRFTINLTSAERAGLKISAQLLKLATAVERQP